MELLRQEAEEKKTTLASIICEKVEQDIKKKRKTVNQKSSVEAFLGLSKLGEKLKVNGPKDLSQRIDEFVYR